ncbi:App1 family protein [Raineyella fluvialis]|uniref:DUF2183 domain-containing protein n=1 Tax=Raineyella fluvialis TaxID=2662261 RepID=A0A5Q2FD95_9ACTN|nr:phosphatase domain-containing protein [Raineyella fluvialis]QGF24779.1 DUF2183 domain-containing protein [Raineyella fluvialis]
MSRSFFAARVEEALNRAVGRFLRRRGWKERVVAYTGYGDPTFVRVMARLILVPERSASGAFGRELLKRRGWRNFLALPVVRGTIVVHTSRGPIEVRTDRSGYIDVRLENGSLEPGWRKVELSTTDGRRTSADIQVIDPRTDFGIISDIDDTIISTMLPRLMLAAWNSLVVHESARQAVPGMARLYRDLLAEHPGAPLVFVSTGSWNTQPTLNRFLHSRRFPLGAMLLTDWGPTSTGWFRSGREHKEREVRQLAEDFPNIRWVLVGDDGQHDPAIYGRFTLEYPDHVRVVAIRQLTPAEQVLAHGTLDALESEQMDRSHSVPWVAGQDGWEIHVKLDAALSGEDPGGHRVDTP